MVVLEEVEAVDVELVGAAFDVQDAGDRAGLVSGGGLADEELALLGVLEDLGAGGLEERRRELLLLGTNLKRD